MGKRIIRFVFFGNYFIGLLAIALSLETSFQLHLHFNSMTYYALLFCGAVMYYTHAYSNLPQSFNCSNPRSNWYHRHQVWVAYSQAFCFIGCLFLGVFLTVTNWQRILHLPLQLGLVVFVMPLAALLYYGLLPKSFLRLNLRSTGWLKAFVIGFVWACCASLLPIVFLQIEKGNFSADPILAIWLFVKNWMFCTVNAIMFDLKDYEDDSNKQLKTFVVRFGLHNTIVFVLIPLLLIGIFSMLAFAEYRRFPFLPIIINLVPFVLLLIVAYSLHRQKSLLYYLIMIDGLVFLKAICGIVAMQFVH